MTWKRFRRFSPRQRGFSLVELLVVVSIVGIVAAVAIPSTRQYYAAVAVKVAGGEVGAYIKEAKKRAFADGKSYAVTFQPDLGRVSLVSGPGSDGHWNTGDDPVEKSFLLSDKAATLSFGHGSRGPVPTLAAAPDGVSFSGNYCVCNNELTGTAGTVYIQSSVGPAMAIVVNSTDTGCTTWYWNGTAWKKLQ